MRSRRVDLPKSCPYPLDVFFFRMEFTQHLDQYEHATKKKLRRGKDGRIIPERKKASAGYKVKEQQWKTEDLEKAFDLWEKNKTLPPKERLFYVQDQQGHWYTLHHLE